MNLNSSIYSLLKELIKYGINQDYQFLERKYSSLGMYNESKLANIYFTKYLADIFQKNNVDVKVASLHPGVVLSEIFRNTYKVFQYMAFPLAYLFMKSTYYGAQTTLHLCFLDDNEFISGAYYNECKIDKVSSIANDIEKRNIYIEYSKQLIETFGKSYKIELKF